METQLMTDPDKALHWLLSYFSKPSGQIFQPSQTENNRVTQSKPCTGIWGEPPKGSAPWRAARQSGTSLPVPADFGRCSLTCTSAESPAPAPSRDAAFLFSSCARVKTRQNVRRTERQERMRKSGEESSGGGSCIGGIGSC